MLQFSGYFFNNWSYVICNEILKIKGYRDSKWNKVTVLLYYSGICLNWHSGTINFCPISENSSIGLHKFHCISLLLSNIIMHSSKYIFLLHLLNKYDIYHLSINVFNQQFCFLFFFFFFFHFVHFQLPRNLNGHVMYCHHFVSVVVKVILLKYFDLLQNCQANWSQTMWECSLNGPPQSLGYFVLISNRRWPQL